MPKRELIAPRTSFPDLDFLVMTICLAMARSHTGDLDGAVAVYRRALELDPEALPLYRQLARLEIRRGNYAAALPQVRALAERAGDDGETHRQVGEFFEQMGMAQEAASAFERAGLK